MVTIIIFSHYKPKSFLEIRSTCDYKDFDQKNDSCDSIMDNGGQRIVPTLVPICHQNHPSLDPNQVEFLKRFMALHKWILKKYILLYLEHCENLRKKNHARIIFFIIGHLPIQMLEKTHLNIHA